MCTWQTGDRRGKHLSENIHQHNGKSSSFSKSSSSRSSAFGSLFALMKDSRCAYVTAWTETLTEEARLPIRAAPGNSFLWYHHHLYERKALECSLGAAWKIERH